MTYYYDDDVQRDKHRQETPESIQKAIDAAMSRLNQSVSERYESLKEVKDSVFKLTKTSRRFCWKPKKRRNVRLICWRFAKHQKR